VKWVEVKHGDVPGLPENFVLRAPFFHRDMMQWLRQEFSNSNYKGFFVLKAEEQRREDGTRYIMIRDLEFVLYEMYAFRHLNPSCKRLL